MAADFYAAHFLQYGIRTRRIDPTSFLAVVTRHVEKGATVLDIGCGSGRDLLWLKRHGYRPTGFERSAGLADMAAHYAECPVIRGDFTTFDFSTLRFDVVLLIGALVHLPAPALAPTILRISAALGEKGVLYLSLKEGSGQYQAPDGRIFTLWSRAELDAILSASGFSIVHFTTTVSVIETKDSWLGYLLKKK